MFIPKNLSFESEILQDSRRLGDFTDDGTMYSFWADGTIYKSTDFGATETQIATGLSSDIIAQVKKLYNGKIFVALRDGKFYLSDVNESNFTLVYDLGASIRIQQYGFQLYDRRVICVASYTDNPVSVISLDAGETWHETTNIDTFRGLDISHLHDICYDPYENLLWIATGDGTHTGILEPGVRDKIGYSDNWGKSWNWIPPEIYRRVTSIIPLPHCVLFGTDEFGTIGIYKHNRPKNGTINEKVIPELVWSYTNSLSTSNTDPTKESKMCWVTKAAVRYGETYSAYFGFLMQGFDDVPASRIVGTKDGDNFFTVWAGRETPVNAETESVFTTNLVLGPDNQGNLLASIYRRGTSPMGERMQTIKFKDPGWVRVEGT